jgi:hypothetical protein
MLRPRLAILAVATIVAAAGGITAGVISSHRSAAALDVPTTTTTTTTTARVTAATESSPAPSTTRAVAGGGGGTTRGTTPTTGKPDDSERISDPAKAADHLFDAWQAGDRQLALGAASPSAVRALFAIPPTPTPRFGGCRSRDLGFDCVYGYPDADGIFFIDMRVEGGASAGYRVVSIEAPLRFSKPASSARHLLDAWRADDRAAALQAASKSAVDTFFRLADRSRPPEPLGCAFVGAGKGFTCDYTGPEGGRLIMHLNGGASAGWFVTGVTESVDD